MTDEQPVQIDNAVLRRFKPYSGTVPAGYFAHFLGNVTRIDYWACSPEIRAYYDKERVETFSLASVNDDNILDWLVLLEAVVDAKRSFTMAALGAGWGRWLVAAAFAAMQHRRVRFPRRVPFYLIGVEAEPTHFAWIQQHFRDNGLNPADHELIEAAASAERGHVWFYVGKPAEWYGQSIIRDEALNGRSESEADYNGEKARRVRTVDLTELVSGRSRIDYLHMDIQGAELEFLGTAPQLLNAKVKRVLVGTHSAEIEEGLRSLFNGIGWHCQYDIPMNGQVHVDPVVNGRLAHLSQLTSRLLGRATPRSPNGKVLTLGDGVQVWINPNL